MKNELVLAIDYTHNPLACIEHEKKNKEVESIFSKVNILSTKGFYDNNYTKISKVLGTHTAEVIIQIITQDKEFNLLELKKILNYSYGIIHKTVYDLKKMKILKLFKNKGKRGRIEVKISLNKKNVKIIHVSQNDESFKQIIKKQIDISEKEHIKFKDWLNRKIKTLENKK